MQDDAVTAIPPSLRDYVLADVLGRGGMGVVYGATQLSLRRRVAIKIPHPHLAADPMVSRRFRTEALASGRLCHRNVARVIDFGGRNGALYLVMEYIAGKPLDELVIEQAPLEARLATDICRQILRGLHHAHTSGVIHADIKSANVLVDVQTDGGVHAVVIDFGLARFSDDASIHDGRTISGTPDYVAPELVQGGLPTIASDIYAAGVVLYELITGKTPFGGGTSDEIFRRHIDDVAIPLSLRCPDQDVPQLLDDAVMRALAKDPAKRYETAALFEAALRAATVGLAASSLRLARGTGTVGFSTERTTRDWQRERVQVLRAATGVAIENVHIENLRIRAGNALAHGDSDSIVAAYLELVRAMTDRHQLVAGVGELEHGLAVLREGSATAPAIWRLQLCLAALYSGLGDVTRARAAAALGHHDAVRAASTLGQDRAHDLLARLTR
jgi:predicted Ser/Thr protein kinase